MLCYQEICFKCWKIANKDSMEYLFNVDTHKHELACIDCYNKYEIPNKIQSNLIKNALHEREFQRFNNEKEIIKIMNKVTRKQYNITTKALDTIAENKFKAFCRSLKAKNQ